MNIEDDLLRKACNLLADGSKEDLNPETLHIEIESMKQRHFRCSGRFQKNGNLRTFVRNDGNSDWTQCSNVDASSQILKLLVRPWQWHY